MLQPGIIACSLFSQGAVPIVPTLFANERSTVLRSDGDISNHIKQTVDRGDGIPEILKYEPETKPAVKHW